MRWILLLSCCCALALADEPPAVEVRFAPSGERRVLHRLISAELRRARSQIELALFILTSRDLTADLIRARRRGVRVRALLDARSASEIRRSQHAALIKGGVQVKLVSLKGAGPLGAKYHHKYCVIDGSVVLTGSYNWTVGGDELNHENLLRLRHRPTARAYRAQFERVWSDAARTRELRRR